MKLIGLVTVFFCSSLCGFYLASVEKQKQELFEDLASFVLFLSEEILRGRPIDNIVEDYFSPDKHRCVSADCKNELIYELGRIRFGGRMKFMLCEIVEFLDHFGKNINCKAEYDACRAFYDKLSAACSNNKDDVNKNTALCQRLGVVIGLFLCICLV